ncbi:MAG TPA: DUF969 domain-containing protein [Gemmatirosa sp.]
MRSLLPLAGVLVVIAGFARRVNPLLVVAAAALVTGLAAGQAPLAVLATPGRAFIENRYVAIVWLVVPTIGLLESAGLKQRARALVAALQGATPGRVLLAYLALRQLTAALGLTSLGGHPQMVRPLLAPMVEGAAPDAVDAPARERLRAHAAAVDNIGLFFGEDVFIAIGSILLIKGVLAENGIVVEPTHVALWAVPTAIAAFGVHGMRLLRLDERLARGRRP